MAARKWADLRPHNGVVEAGDEDMPERVVQRLCIGRDGQLFLAWLKEQARAPQPGATDAMLREAEGRRQFIDRLVDWAES
ncbi:hypothetical protein [Brevundimonas sp.]|uniref:hypothetical protein n=1 Tax=Brevundimonas sp. TaxID=1871086 RepID=UPI0035B01F6C